MRARNRRYMYHFMQRLWIVLTRSEFYLLELILGTGSVAWGLWLLYPGWNSFDSTPILQAMGRLAHEETWGLVVAVLGVAQFVSAGWGSVRYRWLVAFAMSAVWTLASATFLLSNPTSPSGVVYSVVFALGEAIIFLRAVTLE